MDGFYSIQLSRLFSVNRHNPPEYLMPVHSGVHLLSLCVIKLQSIIRVTFLYSSIIFGQSTTDFYLIYLFKEHPHNNSPTQILEWVLFLFSTLRLEQDVLYFFLFDKLLLSC